MKARREALALIAALFYAGIVDAFVTPHVAPLGRQPSQVSSVLSPSARGGSFLNLVPIDTVASSSSVLLSLDMTVPRPLADFWANYNLVLEAHPLYTKCATSLVGFILGDLIAQTLVEKSDTIDYRRVARLASFGVLLHGTSGHYFYNMLDTHLPGASAETVAAKVLIDQICWSPVFTTMFFGYNLLLEGKTMDDFRDKLEADLFTGVRGSWSFWGPAHIVNFALIPPSQRLLYINVLQVIYNIFLSFLGNKDPDDDIITAGGDEKPAVQEL